LTANEVWDAARPRNFEGGRKSFLYRREARMDADLLADLACFKDVGPISECSPGKGDVGRKVKYRGGNEMA